MHNITGLFRHATDVERRRAGEVLFEAGTPGTSMYVVKGGQLAIQINGTTVETVDEGGIVGEMSLVDHSPRSATVVALTDCEIVPVDERRFLFLIQQTPYFALEVMRLLAARLRAMNDLVASGAR